MKNKENEIENSDPQTGHSTEKNQDHAAGKKPRKTSSGKTVSKRAAKISSKSVKKEPAPFVQFCRQAKQFSQKQCSRATSAVKTHLPVFKQCAQQGMKNSRKILLTFSDEMQAWFGKYRHHFKPQTIKNRMVKMAKKTKSEVQMHLYLHQLNRQIEVNRKKLVSLYIQLGHDCFQLMEKNELNAPALETLQKQIRDLQKDVSEKQTLLKKILQKK